ncbi:putative tubby-like protein [Helianthus annuus]|uniref:Tubby-like protein n=2 Tax=Helianthus annuus TaxID=4232 RepID=A0A9K3EKT7_HELAN|nr:protein LURP-one-related 11 [Helianthus annuus]KAF5774839.1 putative tubby-like protein [Helianthus annuus]KAJ0478092.1 putative tubby-like protein [Helianthus annuus]KAJ0482749.1 putative tubby-like protein [Helianthus annuus]KAJ0498971.1 putative tubby-like protein [Helianthus annuus]KAJ0664986.1 putative tubby-like protein [Helianthus annuus]
MYVYITNPLHHLLTELAFLSTMAKVYPQTPSSPSQSPSSSPYVSSKQEFFTIWMKSLVYNSHGCTAYNSSGEIVYRVDNYDTKCSSQVYLMDIRGKVLFAIQRKKLPVFGCWDGYKWDFSKKQRWFRVTRKRQTIHVDLGVGEGGYKIVKTGGKLGFKIINTDQDGALVAEFKPKQTASGIDLGNDVFTLTVEPDVDQSLIMAIIMVLGLIHRQL